MRNRRENFRFTEDASVMLERFAKITGLAKTEIVETLVREYIARWAQDELERREQLVREVTTKYKVKR